MNLDIPERLIKAILFVRGKDDGTAWLAALPRRIALYARRWDLTPLEIAEGGAMSCCLFCVTADGREAVLKIPFDAASGRLESRSLVRWSCSGASPSVLNKAPSSGVYLMERIRPGDTAQPRGTDDDSKRYCELITRMSRPELGDMRGLQDLHRVVATRMEWAYERFADPGYVVQAAQMPGVVKLLDALQESTRSVGVLHGDLQAKNILLGSGGDWMAIDPLTCRGELNAEAALWAVVQQDGSTIEQRISELIECDLLQEQRLRSWCYVMAVVEYRAYQPEMAERSRAFTDALSWEKLAKSLSASDGMVVRHSC